MIVITVSAPELRIKPARPRLRDRRAAGHLGTSQLPPRAGRARHQRLAQGPPQAIVPGREAIGGGRIRVDPITIDVQAGYHYFIGVEETRTRSVITITTREGQETSTGDWQPNFRCVLRDRLPRFVRRVEAAIGFQLITIERSSPPID